MMSGYKTYAAAAVLAICGILEGFMGIDIPGVSVEGNWLTTLIAALGLGSLRNAIK